MGTSFVQLTKQNVLRYLQCNSNKAFNSNINKKTNTNLSWMIKLKLKTKCEVKYHWIPAYEGSLSRPQPPSRYSCAMAAWSWYTGSSMAASNSPPSSSLVVVTASSYQSTATAYERSLPIQQILHQVETNTSCTKITLRCRINSFNGAATC